MRFTKAFLFGMFLMLLEMFSAAKSYGQSSAQIVPGFVHIKFQNGALSRLGARMELNDINSPLIRQVLSSRGFKGGGKTFKEAMPGDTLATSRTGEIVKVLDLSHWFAIELDSTVDILGLTDSLRLFPEIAAVAPALVLYPADTYPNDTYFNAPNYYQWGLYNHGSQGNDIHAVQAWDINRGRTDVKIAVIDGGVDYNHSDLDPGNRSRVLQGTDTGDDDNDPMDSLPTSSSWSNHGTAVTGVIGAITNNNTGVAGVMWNCSIIPVKIASTNGLGPFGWNAGGAFDWDIADGINWARNNGAHIMNMSFGGAAPGLWELLFLGNPIGDATYNAYQQGIVLVAAMGNDDISTPNFPAAHPWSIAVGATNQSDQ